MSRACLCICISPFLHLPLWFFLILTVQCAAVFSTLTTSLSPSANPFFPPNSHLHYSPPRLTILFSVSIISRSVFPRHCRDFSSPLQQILLLFSLCLSFFLPVLFSFSSSSDTVLFLIKCRGVDKTATFSVARPWPLLAAKEGCGGQASVSHWAAELIRLGNRTK